jgi:hypothetical protein
MANDPVTNTNLNTADFTVSGTTAGADIDLVVRLKDGTPLSPSSIILWSPGPWVLTYRAKNAAGTPFTDTVAATIAPAELVAAPVVIESTTAAGKEYTALYHLK